MELPQYVIETGPNGTKCILRYRNVSGPVRLIKNEFDIAMAMKSRATEPNRWNACAACKQTFEDWLKALDPTDPLKSGGAIDLAQTSEQISFPLYYDKIIDSLLSIFLLTRFLREHLEVVSRRTAESPELKGPELHVINGMAWNAVWRSECANVLPKKLDTEDFLATELGHQLDEEEEQERQRQAARRQAIRMRSTQAAQAVMSRMDPPW